MAIKDDLVSYYKLDESSGAVIDTLGINNGTNYGAIPNVAGKIETAYDFETTESDYISLTEEGLRITGDYTVNAWFKVESIGIAQTIMRKCGHHNGHTNYDLSVAATNKLQTLRYQSHTGDGANCNSADALTSTSTISAGVWYMGTVTFDASTKKFTLYFNGGEEDSVTTAYPVNCYNWAPQPGIIGGFKTSAISNDYFDGIIDEVGIWDKVLTPEEITDLYNSGDGLAYPFEEEPPAPYEYKPVYSKIEIGGTDYADALKITVDRTIGDFNAASNFTAEFDNHHGQYSDTFNLNDEVVIYADRGEKPTTKIFAGVIENISFKGDTEREKINLVGRDYCAILQDMTVKPIIFKDADAGQIAKTIMLNNTEDLLTGNHMNTSTGVTIEKIGFNHKIVFEALKKLAELSDCYFYVDADKDVHFIKKGDIISGLTFNNTNVHDGTFKKTDREIYNKVYVYGARVLTGAKDTGGTWGAGETGSVFRLNDKPHNTNVTVDGVLQYPGGIVGMTDPATEPGLKYLVGFNEKQIIFVSGTAAGENIPSSGTSNVTVEYEKYSPLLKYLEDETSITDYGPKTKIIKDDSFKSYSETSNEATKFLENNKDPKIQGDLDIKGLVDVTPGNTCVVDLPWHGISEQTYTILSASYTFNKYNNLADNVLHITLNKKISDFTDIMKEQMLKTKTIDVGTLEGEYTTLATATADLSIESHFEIYTKDINSNFIFHSEKHGKLEDPNSRIGTGVLGSTLFASGGEY